MIVWEAAVAFGMQPHHSTHSTRANANGRSQMVHCRPPIACNAPTSSNGRVSSSGQSTDFSSVRSIGDDIVLSARRQSNLRRSALEAVSDGRWPGAET